MDDKIKVKWLNHAGNGFAETVELDSGATVRDLFEKKLPGESPSKFMIRLNNGPVAADDVLHDGDTLSVTPTNITGAGR